MSESISISDGGHNKGAQVLVLGGINASDDHVKHDHEGKAATLRAFYTFETDRENPRNRSNWANAYNKR